MIDGYDYSEPFIYEVCEIGSNSAYLINFPDEGAKKFIYEMRIVDHLVTHSRFEKIINS